MDLRPLAIPHAGDNFYLFAAEFIYIYITRILNTACSLVGFSDGCSVVSVCKQLSFSENS